MIPSHKLSLRGASIVFVVALCACSRAPETGAAGEAGAAAEPAAAPEAPGAMTPEGQAAMAESAAAPAPQPPAGEETAPGETVKRSGAVAPAPGAEPSKVKNWMLIEFARPLEDADLAWLKQNGFQVDTVMSPTMVRGWLEKPEGGEVIGTDPRIARIHAQMR